MNAWLPVVVITLANELPYTIIGGQMANCEHLNMLSEEVLSSTSNSSATTNTNANASTDTRVVVLV